MFDSFEANLAFYQRIMAMMGREPLDRGNEEQMRVLHTYANREVLSHLFPDPREWEEAVRCAAQIDYRELVPLMTMEEGFRETLDALLGRVGLGVCTNRSTSMDMVLRSFSLDSYFSIVMTASGVVNPKPHPEPLLKVLGHFGIAPDEALFVGDSEVDRQAAEAAGVPFVAYKTDLGPHPRITLHAELLALL